MKVVFFDLDNTLCDIKQYSLGAFKKISIYLSKECGASRQKVYKNLVNLWQRKTSYYPYLFNDLLDALGIKDDRLIKKIVDIFNEHKGVLRPYSDAIPVLKELRRRGYKLGIITDGNVKRQKRKIKSLGIRKFFATTVCTKETAPKPSPEPFLTAIQKINVNPGNAFYVADNPLIDFEGAKKVGMKTIRLKKGEFAKISKNKYIDLEIKKFNEILNIIK